MSRAELATAYRGYIDCLNARDWDGLDAFVHPRVRRNGELLNIAGYRAMLERDVAAIPDLSFRIDCLVADPPMVAARLQFDCTPAGVLFGLPVDGRRVRFAENVFYAFERLRISDVRSVIDVAAIASQVGAVYRVP